MYEENRDLGDTSSPACRPLVVPFAVLLVGSARLDLSCSKRAAAAITPFVFPRVKRHARIDDLVLLLAKLVIG